MNDVHSPACRGCQSAQDTLDNNPIDNSRALTRRSTNYSDEQTYPKAHRMERHVPPLWTYGDDNNRKLNEQVYITEFINTNQVRCINNQLYSPDGAFEDGRAKQLIIDDIMPYVKSNHGDKAEKLLRSIKTLCYAEPPAPQLDRLHVANGTIYKDESGQFSRLSEDKAFCLNRIPVNFNPDAPKPERF